MDLPWEDALFCAEDALIKDPKNAEAHAFLAQAYAEQGFAEPSRKHLEAAHAFAPENIDYVLALIDDYLHAGEANAALIHLQMLLAPPFVTSSSSSATFVLNVMARLGQCFFFLGQWQDASRAFLEALSQPVQKDQTYIALLYALEIAFRQQQYDQAMLILQSVQVANMPSGFVMLWKTLTARVCYWQGDFVQARDHWQAVLDLALQEQTFQEQAFNALHLLPPPVAQSAQEALKWELLLKDTVALFSERPVLTVLEDQSLFNPFDFALKHNSQEHQRLQELGHWYLRHFPKPEEVLALEESLPLSRHVGVITDFLSAPFCAFVLPWLYYYRQHRDYRLTLFYAAGEIPPALDLFKDLLYQLPAHVPRALTVLREQQVTTLIYTQLKGELYRLAMTPPQGIRQYLYPLHQYYSGLDTLSQDLVTRLCQAGVYFSADCPPAVPSLSRRSIGLPTLGHLYFFTVTPLGWSPAMDALAEAILTQDRKAFIVALKIPESTLHVRAQQRHEQSLTRFHRVRWVNADALDLLPLVDCVVGTCVPESEFVFWQAMGQQQRVGYYDQGQNTPLLQKLGREKPAWVQRDAFSLAKFLTESVRHARLESTSFRALSVDELKVWESILLSLEEPL